MIPVNDKSVGYIYSKEKSATIDVSGSFDSIPPEIKQEVIDIIEALAKKFNGTNVTLVGSQSQVIAKAALSKVSVKKLKPIFKSFGFKIYKFIGQSVTVAKGEEKDRGSYGIHFKYQGKGTIVQNIDVTVMYDANIPASSQKWDTNFI